MDQSKIDQIVKSYLVKKAYEKKYYHTIKKFDKIAIDKNRENARNYYYKNKQNKEEYYAQNKDLILATQRYNYAKKVNKIERFKIKYPISYDLLKQQDKL
tara:strand:+ start:774 stop:1073 length:300 start_codon:yes stop_codon:yes gene_type:complete